MRSLKNIFFFHLWLTHFGVLAQSCCCQGVRGGGLDRRLRAKQNIKEKRTCVITKHNQNVEIFDCIGVHFCDTRVYESL